MVFAKKDLGACCNARRRIVAFHPIVNAQYSSKSYPRAQVGSIAQVLGVEVRRILGRGVKILGSPGELAFKRPMKVTLGTFASKGIWSRPGAKVSKEVLLALREYAEQLRSGQRPIGMPAFCCEEPQREATLSLDLLVDKETTLVLEREAKRQGTTVDRLATHAVLIYLADLDRRLGTVSGVRVQSGQTSNGPAETRA